MDNATLGRKYNGGVRRIGRGRSQSAEMNESGSVDEVGAGGTLC